MTPELKENIRKGQCLFQDNVTQWDLNYVWDLFA